MKPTLLNPSDHSFGKSDASIMVVVYEDYECEYCEKAFDVLKQMRKDFQKELCVVYRHFPLVRMHPSPLLAALVVEACALQGKFLQAHDLIFERQEYLEYRLGGILRLLEKDHGVVLAQLHEDLKKLELKQKIDADIESGLQCGITITPAVFINSQRYVRKLEFSVLAEEIKKVLSKQQFNKSNLIRIADAPQLSLPRQERNTTGQYERV